MIPKEQRSIYAATAMIIDQQLKNQNIRDTVGQGYSHGMSLNENQTMFDELYSHAASIIFKEAIDAESLASVKESLSYDYPNCEKRLDAIFKTVGVYHQKLLDNSQPRR